MKKSVLVLVAACFFPACQAIYRTPEEVASAVTVSQDKFKNQRTIKTPWIQGNDYDWAWGKWGPVKYFLRRIDDGPGTRGISQIYVRYRASSWAFLHSAFLPGGRALDTTQIDRDVSVGITEDIAITLDGVLATAALDVKSGFLEIKLYGKKRNCTFNVSPIIVKGFLQALTEHAAAPPR